MFNQSRAMMVAAGMLSALLLSGCGGSGVDAGKKLNALTCGVNQIPNSSNTQCVAPPPPVCTAPEVLNEAKNACVQPPDPNAPPPSITAAADQAILFYNRPQDASNTPGDSVYDGWKLHTWSNGTCDAYADGDTDWASGRVHDGIDPNYGAYWLLKLKPGYAGTPDACANFIIHKGTSGDAGTTDGKEMGGGDFKMPLSQPGEFARMNWVFSGVASVYENPIASLGVAIGDAAAHWLDATTLVWKFDSATTDVTTAKLVHSAAADITIENDALVNGQSLDLTETTLTDEQKARYPQFADWKAFSGNWSTDDAKGALKNQLVIAAFDASNKLSLANKVQAAKVLDSLYTSGDNDADEAALGLVYNGDNITANLWAPTAQSVTLKVYNQTKTETASSAMTLDSKTGIWSFAGDKALDRQFYRFEVKVYHPVTGKVETLLSTDPYSVSLSTNGVYSQFVNLQDDDLKPSGWDAHAIPEISQLEDAVIYEGHIRDFSVRDDSTSAANRGKYLAFTEKDSLAVKHLQSLKDNGLTHFHMLPANDMATVNEDSSKTVTLNSTVQQLCDLNAGAGVCADSSVDKSATLMSVFQGCSAVSEPQKAQALTNDIRGVDQFNWGYDPHHFTAPEGSYSSNPDGVARIKEMRAMNQALHEMGLRVVLDVVYNHTNASGVNDKSVLDKVVPGYYHRYDINTGSIIRETCCDDTEPRHRMMAKLMQDSLLVWTQEYKFDSFRFDIMSQASKQTMLDLRAAVQAVDPDNYFYGEGWTRTDRGYEQANQGNMAGSNIGTFNDRIREAVRQGEIFNPQASEGALAAQDKVKMSLAGTLADYVLKDYKGVASNTSSIGGYAKTPGDIINYVSKHDNETLWDQLQYTLPTGYTLEQRVRAQNVAATIPLVSQGIPFLQLGGDFLRSKSMDRNTYDSGDWFNFVDYTKASNNWNVGLPLAQDNQGKWEQMATFIYSPERAATMSDMELASGVFNELLSIRKASPLFRLTSAEDVIKRVGFHNIGKRQTQGLIVMSIDDGTGVTDLDTQVDAVVVVINSSSSEQSHSVKTAQNFSLHTVQAGSVDSVVRTASYAQGEGQGTFTVPALTTAVFVKNQSGAQGEGLSATATAGAPDVVPYGSTAVYLRGSMNGWSTDNSFSYKGAGVYEVAVALNANEEYMFKFASEDWSTVNFGCQSSDAAARTVTEGTALALGQADDNNLIFTPVKTATYVFSVDASNKDEPLLTIVNEEPFVGTTVYLRGSMNGWSTDNAFNYDGGRVYSLSVQLNVEDYQFKVASEDWSTVNLGGGISGESAAKTVTVGQETALGQADDNNLQLSITEAGEYVFIFDLTKLSEPVIKVFSKRFFGSTPVYIRGSMNGWGTASELAFNAEGAYFIDLQLEVGEAQFKVASEDWSTVNFGGKSAEAADKTVILGTALTLGQADDNNLLFNATASGSYRFTVTGPDAKAPKVTVTQL